MQYKSLMDLFVHESTELDAMFDILRKCQYSQPLREADLVSSIPDRYRIGEAAEMPFATALIYLFMHPIFTADLAWLVSTEHQLPCSTMLLDKVAHASKVVIEDIAARNQPLEILCVWIECERLLQAGLIWAIFVLHKHGSPMLLANGYRDRAGDTRATSDFSGKISLTSHRGRRMEKELSDLGFHGHSVDKTSLLEPLILCTSTLKSLAGRWKQGSSHCLAWDSIYPRILNTICGVG